MLDNMNRTATPEVKSSPLVARICNQIIRWTVCWLAVLMPIFFLPWTLEVVELNKQLLLLLGAVVAGMAWFGRMLVERKFEYRRSIVNVMVVLFVAVYAISAWRSYNPYLSVMGDFGQELSGLVTVIALATLYFVVANNFKTIKDLRLTVMSMMLGGFLAGLYAMLQGLGLFLLPFEFAKDPTFNTVGTATTLGVYMAFVATLSGGLILMGHGERDTKGKLCLLKNIFIGATGVVALSMVAVINYWPVTLCLLLGSSLLVVFAFIHAKSLKGISGVMLPIAAIVLSLLLLVFGFPLKLNYPAEVTPSLKASYDITIKTLREKPFFGSGPGTFLYDYAMYRSPDVNNSVFWNIRFDRSSNYFMTTLATTGLLGALSWLFMAMFMLFLAARKLLRSNEATWHLLIGLFAAWLPLVVARFLYGSNMTLEFIFWMMMGVLVAFHKPRMLSVKFESSPRAAMGVSFVFILSVVFAVAGLFVEGTRYSGEIAYAQAIRTDRAGGEIDEVVSKLGKAVNLNSKNDVYIRNLALALLSKADYELNREIKLERKEDETDEAFAFRRQAAGEEALKVSFTLSGQAVNMAKRATEINPRNVANWTVLGSIYEALLGVSEDADQWALSSYERSIELEPSNPVTYTQAGKILLYQADRIKNDIASVEDEAKKKELEGRVNDLLNKATENFNKSIELKGDYAPARYNLAMALDRQDKLDEAISRMEEVVQINNQDVGVGFQLALMYFRAERKDPAVKLMESVVRLSPNFSNARWYLAAMYEEAGNLDGAIAQITEVQRLNEGNDTVTKKLEELRNRKNPAPEPVPEEKPVEGEQPEGELPSPVEESVETANQPEVQR